MIKISITEEGTVKFGGLQSYAHHVKFFTRSVHERFDQKQGSKWIMEFLSEVLDSHQLEEARVYARSHADKKLYFRHFYSKCSEFLGCTPKNAVKLWNAAEFYTKVEPRLDLVNLLARGRGGKVSRAKFMNLVRNEKLLKEVCDDGLKNILPLVFFFNEPPQTLKKTLGKGLWKRLSRNSFHRNRLLAQALYGKFHYCDAIPGDIAKDSLIDFEKIPSTLLANRAYLDFYEIFKSEPCLDYIEEKMFKLVPMKDINRSMLRLARSKITRIRDTYVMAEQLGEKFNIWKHTIDNFEIEHDRFTKMIQERRYSPEPIECLSEITEKYIKFGDYEVELLDSRYKIHEEGQEMKHCVGGYCETVARGGYLVYSIKKDGKRVSTLGLKRSHRTYTKTTLPPVTEEMMRNRELAYNLEIKKLPVWDFNQHYGFANTQLESMTQVFLADLLISRLNGEEYISEEDLEKLEYIIANMDSVPKIDLESDIDRFKFNPYNPSSYKSLYDYRYQKVERDDRYDQRAYRA